MDLLKSLALIADEEQFHLNPLNEHVIAEQGEHLRSQYALLLASVLTAQPSVSESQTRLFRLLLDALRLGDIRAQLFEQAQELTPELLLEAVRLVREEKFARFLVLDALVLLRIEAQLSDELVSLVSELSSALNLGEQDIKSNALMASRILGLTQVKVSDNDFDYERALLVEKVRLWPGYPSEAQRKELRAKLKKDKEEYKAKLERKRLGML